MRYLLPVLLLASLGMAIQFGPAGMPLDWRNLNIEWMESSKFTSPSATSYLSMVGDTLYFTSETPGDVYWTIVDSLGNEYQIYADVSEEWLQFPSSAFGSLLTPDDGGMVAIFDRDVTSSAVDGVAQGVIFRADTVDVLSVGALATGAGSVDSVFVEFHGDVITESGHYGWTGTWVNAESDTVKVENGIIYDVVAP